MTNTCLDNERKAKVMDREGQRREVFLSSIFSWGRKTDKKQKGKLPGEMGTGLGDPCH